MNKHRKPSHRKASQLVSFSKFIMLVFGFQVGIGTPPSAAQSNDIADSYDFSLWHEQYNAKWEVNSLVAVRLDAKLNLPGKTITNTDVLRFFDQTIQNSIGRSRARMGMRVQNNVTNCNVTDGDHTPCLMALFNVEDAFCNKPSTPLAHAGCDAIDGCNIVICVDNIGTGPLKWGGGGLQAALAHELGHATGLSHVVEFGVPQGPNSDGCDRELMCQFAPDMNSMFLENGDSKGLRQRHEGTTFIKERKVVVDRDENALNNPNWTTLAPIQYAAFQPRIDCAKDASSGFECAAVVATNNEIKVIRLGNPNPSSEGWITQTVVATIIGMSDLAPDIALSRNGTTAYVVTTTGPSRVVRLHKVPMNGGTVSSKALPTFHPVLPPRVSNAGGRPLVIVSADTGSTSTSPILQFSRWMFASFDSSTLSETIHDYFPPFTGGVDIDGDFNGADWAKEHTPTSEFDFDCYTPNPLLPSSERCTLVTQFLDSDNDYQVSSMHSLRFYVQTIYQGRFAIHLLRGIDADWDNTGLLAANSISGVFLSGGSLWVSHGRPLVSGTSTRNYRIQRISGERVSGAVLDHRAVNSDGDACSASVNLHGDSMPGASTSGGASIAICPSCRSGGSLEQISWGRRFDNDSFCH